MQVLVVDDSALIRDLLSTILVEAGYRPPLLAKGAREAKSIIKKEEIDLILMDIEMPGLNGVDFTRQIRRNLKAENWIPIIFLTIKEEEQYLADAIDAGGDDYLVKPVNKVVVLSKIRAMQRIADMKAALDETNFQLSRLTQIDALTGTMNRRGFQDAMQHAWRLHKRNRDELCVVFADIDDFKNYNDRHGHPQGDQCLRQVARIMQDNLRNDGDMLSRYGGEEFVFLLPATRLRQAEKFADQLLSALQDAYIPHPHSRVAPYVTCSLGISSSRDGARSAQALLSQADRALYEAKSAGRNRACCFEDMHSSV